MGVVLYGPGTVGQGDVTLGSGSQSMGVFRPLEVFLTEAGSQDVTPGALAPSLGRFWCRKFMVPMTRNPGQMGEEVRNLQTIRYRHALPFTIRTALVLFKLTSK